MPQHARLPLWDAQSPTQKLETLRRWLLDLYRYQLGDALADIASMLEAHQPGDEQEARDVQQIKRLLAQHPNILNMNCEIGHITASALVVDLNSGRTLLHFHKRLGRWLPVGGHADYETDFSRVALREAREETGLPDLAFYPPRAPPVPIDYDVHSIPQRGAQPQHLHLDFRYVLVTQQPAALAPAAGESTALAWLSWAEALERITPEDAALRRLLHKAQALFAR